ncbi:MAG: response regulator [Syntrophobacterales bacterium]|nr:response regulator [Syntrophobacterales bacterium]
MKTLIVEDDFTSRVLLQEILCHYGPCHIAVNGKEAVEAVKVAIEAGEPYDLICLDIMMPGMDGHEALQKIREIEERHGFFSKRGAKIVMVTALHNIKNISLAYKNLCDAYIIKPLDKNKLLDELKKLRLIA